MRTYPGNFLDRLWGATHRAAEALASTPEVPKAVEEPARFSRGDLERCPRKLLHRGRRYNPDVWLVDTPGEAVVWKDFSERGPLVRRFWGRRSIRREVRAYRALLGHPRVPRLRAEIDALSFAVEYRPGRPLSRRVRRHLHPEFFADLERAVTELHARGVVHLDLRHRSNVLVDPKGEPILIDFGSALLVEPGTRRWKMLCALDRRAVEKWRRRSEALSS